MLQKLRVKFLRFRRLHLPRRIRRFKLMSRHPHAVPVITFSLLIVLTAGGYLLARGTNNLPPTHDAKVVIISHDDQQQIVPSKTTTVGGLLKKLNLKLHEGDVVEPAATAVINQDQFRINIYRAKPVQIVDGASRTFAYTAAKTPRASAVAAGASVFPEDKVNTSPVQDFIKTGAIGEQVVIDRATPIEVDLYGAPVTLRTHAKTVGELIKEKNIKLIKDDRVVPAADTPLATAGKVSFIRTGTRTETVTEEIAMPKQQIQDNSLAYGTTAVRQQGAPGQQTVTYQVSVTNNVETARTVIQKVVTKAPVTQVEVVGKNLSGIKGDMALAGISPGDYNYVDYIFTHESHWNPAALNAAGCAGLGQACPGSKLAAVCPNWQNNPVCQIKFFNGYAIGRYKSWAAAYSFKVSRGWW